VTVDAVAVLADLLTEDEESVTEDTPTPDEVPTPAASPPVEPPIRSASPVPPPPDGVPTEVRDDEVVMTLSHFIKKAGLAAS
jgi:hypothetical protein